MPPPPPPNRKRSASLTSIASSSPAKRPRPSTSSAGPLHFLTLDSSGPVHIPDYPSFRERLRGTSTWGGTQRGGEKDKQRQDEQEEGEEGGRAPHFEPDQEEEEEGSSGVDSPFASTSSRRSSFASTARTSLSLSPTLSRRKPLLLPPTSTSLPTPPPEALHLPPLTTPAVRDRFLPAFSPALTAAGDEEEDGGAERSERRRGLEGREGEVRKAVTSIPSTGTAGEKSNGRRRRGSTAEGDESDAGERKRKVQVDLGKMLHHHQNQPSQRS